MEKKSDIEMMRRWVGSRQKAMGRSQKSVGSRQRGINPGGVVYL